MPMGLLKTLSESLRRPDDSVAVSEIAAIADRFEAERATIMERVAELELQLEDSEWLQLGVGSQWEFSREGLTKARKAATVMSIKNPLIRRAVNVQAYYVFGQGITIAARDEEVNDVLQDFLGEPHNRAQMFGPIALGDNERELQRDGDFFSTLFVNASTGSVKVRIVEAEEVTDIVTNPKDRAEVWFYLREWTEESLNLATGEKKTTACKAYYVDWRYYPSASKIPDKIGQIPVATDDAGALIRMYHLKAGSTRKMRFGLPDFYAAMDWAKAYNHFLEDWATVSHSLATLLYQYKLGRQRASAIKSLLNSSVSTDSVREASPQGPVGQTIATPEGSDLSVINTSGARASAEDGRQLRTMVAAGTDTADTILAGDPDMGNLATAKTLDRPMELAMMERQTMWAEIIRDHCEFAIAASIEAPSGPLTGIVAREDGRTTITLAGDLDPTVEVTFPPILEADFAARVTAIIATHATGLVPDEVIARELLTALEIEDVQGILDEIADLADTNAPVPAPDAEPTAEALMVEAVRDLRAALG